MMMIKKIAIFLVFFVMLISPVLAYVSPVYRVNFTLTPNLADLSCVNDTADHKTYCHAGGTGYGGSSPLYQFEDTGLTFDNLYSCSDYIFRGLITLNKTHLINNYYTAKLALFNVTKISSGTCAVETVFGSPTDTNTRGGARYKNSTYDYIYLPKQSDMILNTSNGAYIKTPAGLSTATGDDFTFPNTSDNTTHYTGRGSLVKWTNGVSGGEVFNMINNLGFQPAGFEMIKHDASTTWLYTIHNPTGSVFTVSKYNYTGLETVNGTNVSMYEPSNSTYSSDEQPTFRIGLKSSGTTAGTIKWYIDGVNVKNDSVTSNATLQTFSYAPVAPLTSTGHYWSVTFTDSLGTVWIGLFAGTQSTIYFTIGDLGMFPLFSGWIGDLFGITNEDTKDLLLAVIVSLIAGLTAMYFTKKFSGQVFLGVFFAMFFVFIVGGYVPTWIAFILLIVIGYLFVQTIKGQFGGG